MGFPENKTIALVCIALLGLILVSGCFKMDTQASADADGTLSAYSLELTTSSQGYGLIKKCAKEDGYTDVKEYVEAETRFGDISYEESWNGDSVTLTILENEPMTSEATAVTITEEDGCMVYRDTRFSGTGEQMDLFSKLVSAVVLGGCALHYSLEMPEEIVESNADTVSGKRAEWHLNGFEIFETTIYAKSGTMPARHTEDVSTPSLPGFGALLALRRNN